MLKQRIITAAILIPIVIGLLFFLPPPAFCILSALFMLAGAAEWVQLMKLSHTVYRLIYLFLMLCTMFALLFVPTPLILTLTACWWLVALVLVVLYPRGASYWARNKIIKGCMGFMVLIPCWVALNYIRNQDSGIYIMLFLLVLIWGADTAAYFVGKKWGKTKLAPTVSPGKSIQGAIGAVVFAIVVTAIAGAISQPPAIVLMSAVGLSVTTVLFSILGDLFESAMKREAGVKDSGYILPGHGGILDRIDSLTAAAPIYAFGSLVLSWLFS